MKTKRRLSRERRIELIRLRLLRKSTPRLQLILILFFTGLAGLFASFTLLHWGIWSMTLRYPMAILLAYFVFLGLLALWLWLQKRNSSFDLDQEFVFDLSDTSSTSETVYVREDETFGAGGAGGSWDEGASSSTSISTDSSSGLGVVDAGFDLDEGFLVVLAVVAVGAGLLASLYIVYIAPALLAEILVDGLLVASLYKRVKGIERRHWLRAAVRRTVVPALLAAMFFGIAGYALKRVAPEARSIGEVWRYTRG